MIEQILVGRLKAGKRLCRRPLRDEGAWVLSLKAVDRVDELQPADPIFRAEQIEWGRVEVIDWRFISGEKTANLRQGFHHNASRFGVT